MINILVFKQEKNLVKLPVLTQNTFIIIVWKKYKVTKFRIQMSKILNTFKAKCIYKFNTNKQKNPDTIKMNTSNLILWLVLPCWDKQQQ